MDVGHALALIEAPDADPLQVAAACEAVKAWADARQLQAIHDLTEQEPAGFDPRGQLVDPAPAELACYLSWTAWAASRRVDLAADLHDALPDVLDALRTGLLDLAKATEIVAGTSGLTPSDRVMLAERAVGYATGHTRPQLRAWIDRQVVTIDPEAAGKRRGKARKQRRVWVQPESDGMATIGAYLTAEEAQACYQSLHAAAANHEGGVEAARADLFVHRVAGLEPADPVPVHVIVTPAGPELSGHGPISPAHFAALAEGAPRVELTPPRFTIGYAPTAALKTWVRARDRRCRFRGCRRPATHCDIDHITPWPAGATETQNLHCLCRYHHRLKTHTRWQVRRNPDGTTTWISPRGHYYTTDPDDP